MGEQAQINLSKSKALQGMNIEKASLRGEAIIRHWGEGKWPMAEVSRYIRN